VTHQAKPDSDYFRAWSFLVGAIAAIIAATVGINRLNAWSDQAAIYERELFHLEAVANRLDSLEWRAIASKKVDRGLEKELAKQREEAQLIIKFLKSTTHRSRHLQAVEPAYQTYASAVNELLELLKYNQIAEAIEVDQKKVDPSYEKLYEIIIDEIELASKTSRELANWANLGSLLITMFLVITLAFMFQRYVLVNQKVQEMVLQNARLDILEEERQLLESRVIQRTQELQQVNTALSQALIDLKQSQMQLIQSEKMSGLGQLVAGVAHEINNPVNFVEGNLSYVLEYAESLFGLINLYEEYYPQPVPEIQEEIEQIDLEFIQSDLPKVIKSMQIGTERISQIVISLRNFSRLEEAKFKPANIHEGIDSTLLILQHRLQENSKFPAIQVFRDYAELPLIECYPSELNQVFMNILANAIDAIEEANLNRTSQQMQEYPSQIIIRTSVVDQESIEVAIADNGAGIPEQIQQQIFNPFFTTKPIGKGTGLGMSISYNIITERHGGKLKFSATPGKSTEFIIRLPIQQSSFHGL
jgi:signal transduction histidine kinase